MNHHNISVKLENQANGLQDRIELEFKAQMDASREELLFLQKEMTDKIKIDLKRASEWADDLQDFKEKFNGLAIVLNI